MKFDFQSDDFREIENDLVNLSAVTSKAVVRRGLSKVLQPIADTANVFWPGANDAAFAVSDKVKSSQPQLSSSESSAAVYMFVGSTEEAWMAHILEWGTVPRFHKSGKYVGAVAPTPSLTPAWEAHLSEIVAGLAAHLREEFDATLSRRRKRGLV